MRRVFNACLLVCALTVALPVHGAPLKLLMLGDSLTAGYGLYKGESIPAQLQRTLRAEGLDVTIINAGVSGDTSAGGLARLAWSLAEKPDAVIVELGANDGLRGLDPEETYRNLDTILRRIRATGTPVLLAGMLAPPIWGANTVTSSTRCSHGSPRSTASPSTRSSWKVLPLNPNSIKTTASTPMRPALTSSSVRSSRRSGACWPRSDDRIVTVENSPVRYAEIPL